MGSLERIRERTKHDVENALVGMRTRRADLLEKLRELDEEIVLGEQWLGNHRSGATTQPSLHVAMIQVLMEGDNQPMRPQRLADVINAGRLYRQKDGGP